MWMLRLPPRERGGCLPNHAPTRPAPPNHAPRKASNTNDRSFVAGFVEPVLLFCFVLPLVAQVEHHTRRPASRFRPAAARQPAHQRPPPSNGDKRPQTTKYNQTPIKTGHKRCRFDRRWSIWVDLGAGAWPESCHSGRRAPTRSNPVGCRRVGGCRGSEFEPRRS